jgi:multidrug efflux pump subunit AcrA (membrane-fusion protein)
MLQKLYGWYGKRVVFSVIAVTVLLIGFIIFKVNGNSEVVATEEIALPEVTVNTPASLQNSDSIKVIGVVSAKTQAKLQAETSGRITSVNVSLGQQVFPGTIIAQLENASQRASLLQAEGIYEGAIAQASQSNISVAEAETRLASTLNGVRSTNQSAFTTVNDILLNTIDKVFSSANAGFIGLRIDGKGQTVFLNEERTEFRAILTNWDTTTQGTANILQERTDVSIANSTKLLRMIDVLIPLMTEQKGNTAFTEAEVATIANGLTTARVRVVAIINSLEEAKSSITSANDALDKAKLVGSGGVVSVSDAQSKQALGSLLAAQANYAKTIIRSPIAGTVNQLKIKAGDYISIGAPVAEISNANGLEVATYIDESEAGRIKVGDTVTLDSTATGTITNISPAIDPATGKVELRIGVMGKSLTAGDTIDVEIVTAVSSNTDEVIVPLSAIKLGTDTAFIFTVSDQGILVSNLVLLGPVSGENVIVKSGITATTPIVVDARGRKAGEKVTISKN